MASSTRKRQTPAEKQAAKEQEERRNRILVESSRLFRTHLIEDEFPKVWIEAVTQETVAFLERRLNKMNEVVDVNNYVINTFLLLMMAPAYNINSPFDLAGHIQTGEMPHGDSTGFGKFVEDKILPIFGVMKVPEKNKRTNPKSVTDLYSPIDAMLEIEGQTYYATWKAGPWTMNQTHANEMGSNFPTIYERTGREIILGIFYGNYNQLTNKPALVIDRTGHYFHVSVGKDLWELITGYKNAHIPILHAMQAAQGAFAETHGGKTFYEHMIESRLKLTDSLRKTYEIETAGDEMWERLIEAF